MNKIDKKELKNIFEQIKIDRKKGTEKLCSKYYKIIYGIAFSILKNKEDTEDAVQNFVTKIYSMNIEKFPKDKEATWLYTVVKNEALQIIRKKNKELNIYEDTFYELKDENNEIENIIDKESFNKLISNLNDKEKEIVVLKIISNLSFKEISELLEQPTSTIKWKYYRAVYKIKLLLGNIAMFIVTFTLGIFTLKSNIKKISKIENAEKHQNNTNQELSETEKIGNLQGKTEFTTENQNVNNLQNVSDVAAVIIDNSILENNNSTTASTAIENNVLTNNTETNTIENNNIIENANYIGISILGISLIFLIITIYTIINTKIKLKLNKKHLNSIK